MNGKSSMKKGKKSMKKSRPSGGMMKGYSEFVMTSPVKKSSNIAMMGSKDGCKY